MRSVRTYKTCDKTDGEGAHIHDQISKIVVTMVRFSLLFHLGSHFAKAKEALTNRAWGSLYREFRILSSDLSWRGMKVGEVSRIHIWSPPQTLFLATQLSESLSEMGIKARILHKAVSGVGRADLEIILAPAFFGLPITLGPRIVFQLEQTTSTRWWTPEYINYMNNSLAVFEYSKFNVDKLIQFGVDSKKIYHVPLGGSTNVFSQSMKSRAKALTHDKKIIAYGWFTGSPRRERFTKYANEQMPSLIVHADLFSEAMAKELESSDVVVHINYYTPAILATPRLWESLSRGCQVVSEKAINWREDPCLLELVRFVDEDKFDLVLDNANGLATVSLEVQDRLKTIARSEMRFNFMLARGLFGAGVIDEITFTRYKRPL
jgi:hypothetical protein